MKNKTRKSFFYYLGNFLIVASIAILLFIYFPFIQFYFFSPKMGDVSKKAGYYIEIPKIQAQAPIILNVNPWEQGEYKSKLKQGVAHAEGTVLPGTEGVSYLFAHSTDYPWNIGRYNTVFFKLDKLNINDEIIIYINGGKYIYKVNNKKIVWPGEINYLTNIIESQSKTNKKELILQTCYPIGTAFQRLLIFAEAM